MRVIFLSLLLLFTACSTKESYLKRVALVIGNQDYIEDALDNPINDAKDIKKALLKVGYKDNVVYRENLTFNELQNTLDKLEKMIEPNNTILFIYFAGHGNTIAPYSENIYLRLISKEGEKKALYSIYRLYDFIKKTKARHNIIAIDVCRDFKAHYVASGKKYRGSTIAKYRYGSSDGTVDEELVDLINSHSHTPSILPPSTLLSTATQSDQKASDKSSVDSRHSPYARQLIKFLNRSDLNVKRMFMKIRDELGQETKQEQQNKEQDSMTVDVYLPQPRGGKSTGITY